ncbi:MAG: hypothetical protein M1562_03105 [Candidatus Marsarchaeota archaeon]|jgi:ribosomal protein L22|nr:hypothetical protein [Candidatus Marsarchaeota archaeon]
MRYSFNTDKSRIALGCVNEANASYKDLSAVCAAIRYRPYSQAVSILNSISNGMPIEYRRHNKGMGSRHELGGRKGRTPIRCSKIVSKALINAVNNAKNRGMSEDMLVVVHASANKTFTATRRPPKGRQQGSPYGRYGYNTMAHSDLEFSKVEIGVSAEPESLKLAKSSIKMVARNRKRGLPERMRSLESKALNSGRRDKRESKQHQQKKHPLQKGQVKPKTESEERGVVESTDAKEVRE